jgi:hypothetical protein
MNNIKNVLFTNSKRISKLKLFKKKQLKMTKIEVKNKYE